MRVRTSLLACVVLAALLTADAAAQRLDVNVSPMNITFAPEDPDASPVLFSPPVQVRYRIRTNTGPWTLSVLAQGDLISGGATVDISNIAWVATPSPPFQNGTLSKTVAQTLASGTGSVQGTATGQVTFRLANLWTYSAGAYTQSVIFTLTAP
jgi:hypothetical protein